MKKNTKYIGEITEGVILSKFLLNGYVVLQPFGDNQRYDLVIEKNKKFKTVQCKTGRVRNGSVYFNTSSNAGGNNRKSYISEIDFFAVYCPENKQCYLIPIDKAPKSSMVLRIEKPKNNLCINTINWANDYII